MYYDVRERGVSIYLNQLSLDESKFLHILFMAVASAGLVNGEEDFLEQILLPNLQHQLLFYN